MGRVLVGISLVAAVFTFGSALAVRSQSTGWVGADGRVHHATPQAQQPAAGPDGMVTMTDPNTGQTYTVRAHNAAGVRGFESVARGTTASATAAPSAYVRWQDPDEGAFSLAVPSGWQVSGGTVRTTRIEPHYVVRADSPSGGVKIFMDDPAIAIRQVPNQMTQMMGWREGQAIPSSWGGKLLLARYVPAPQVAEQYVRARFCPAASNFQGGFVPGQSQSLNQQMGAIAQAEGKRVHVDVGEVSFKCGTQNGYAYAITLQAWQQGAPVSLWVIYRIAGYLANPNESAAATDAINTMLGTFEMNQQWLQGFARESNDMAGAVIRESNAITATTIARAKEQDAAMQARNDAWTKNEQARFDAIEHTNKAITGLGGSGSSGNGHGYNAQLGTKQVCDDMDRCQTVDASVDTYYSDCSGTFYPGTSSGSAPSSSLSACWNKGH
jgi:hypothetical protein